jgi:hydrogenase nickel incorporation protein HypA/HybF
MGIALRILDIAISALPENPGEIRVESVNMKVGKLSGVVPETLRFCFSVACQDTPFAGAALTIEEVPIEAACTDCGARFTIEEPRFVCGKCGSGRVEIHSGRELTVTSLELAGPPSSPEEEAQ